MRRIFLILMVLVLVAPMAEALRISPAIIQYGYTPGEYREFTINVHNDKAEDVVIEVTFSNYPDHFEILNHQTNKIPLKVAETKPVTIGMTFPELERFGNVRFATIRFYQVPPKRNQVGATVAIRVPLDTYVPYPDQFLKINLQEAAVAAKGSDAQFEAELINLGQESLVDLKGKFVLRRPGFETDVPIEDVGIMFAGDIKSVSASMPTNNLESGVYNLTLEMTYNGGSKESDKQVFIVGAEDLEIISIEPREFENVKINELRMTFLNLWISGISPSVRVQLLQGDQVLRTFEAGRYTLPVGEQKTILTNVNFEGIEAGDYTLAIIARDGDIEKRKDFNIRINARVTEAQEAPSKPIEITTILIGGLVATVILLLLMVLLLGYRVKNDKKKPKRRR